ncbi:MAG TPA: DoxX family protein, partial [Chloroflexota bacterium]|nr:DoxX family protein [Chloroflexota bacterium]
TARRRLAGGLMMVLGVLVPLSALVLAVDMVVAILFRAINLGFISGGGVELNPLILAIILALVLLGPGRYSLEALIRRAARLIQLSGSPGGGKSRHKGAADGPTN